MKFRPPCLLSWLIVASCLIIGSNAGNAQTVLMHQMSSIKVVVPYPGLTISVTRILKFANPSLHSGRNEISRTSDRVGRFTLTGVYRFLPIYMSIKAPKFLVGDADSIRYSGGAAFNDRSDNAGTASEITTSGNGFEALRLGANREQWTGFAYVYFFGALKIIHKVPPGVYTGAYEITLIL